MAHRHQHLIDQILADEPEQSDHSLRRKALARATSKALPRTMTPWEWEQYYAENGIPERHRASTAVAPRQSWWRRLLRCVDKPEN